MPTAQRSTRKKYVPSEKQRAEDEKLREELRNFDLKKFDKALERALTPARQQANKDSGRE